MEKEKETPKKPKTDNLFERDIDPAVASRVEEIMNEGSDDAPSKSIDETIDKTPKEPTGGAPLLPTDKLPDSVKSQPKTDDNTEKTEADINKPSKAEQTAEQTSESRNGKVDIDDPDTEKAVDEIANEESDRMLAIEDAKAELISEGSAEISQGFFTRIRLGLANLWSHTSVKIITIFLVFLSIGAVAIYPDTRYYVLNAAGVRASTSLTILDEKTRQPLKDAEVSIEGLNAKTDKEGYVQFSEIKLGRTDLSIKKPAFAPVSKEVTIGWGSNPQGDIDLTAVGSRYKFEVSDFLSGQPITKAEAISGQASAVADEKGTLELVVEGDEGKNVEIEIKADNYRSERLSLPIGGDKTQKISMVPSRKHAFISKRDGMFDLFVVDVDGKNLSKVLPGTGKESEDNLTLHNHPTSDVVALVSTRGGEYSPEGNPYSTLSIVNIASKDTAEVTEAKSIQIIDFVGDKLIYLKETKDSNDESPNRFRLMSYDTENREEKELASASYFNDVLVAKGVVYFSPANADSKKTSGFFKINPDGTSKETILEEEAWNFFRASYDKLHVAFPEKWYEYDLNNNQLNQLEGTPANNRSRIYVDSPNGQRSLWVDERDGKGVLLLYDVASGKDKSLQSTGGLKNPIRWLDNDHLVYRVSNGSETADYVISISGGEPKKLQDVTDTIGLDSFYYY